MEGKERMRAIADKGNLFARLWMVFQPLAATTSLFCALMLAVNEASPLSDLAHLYVQVAVLVTTCFSALALTWWAVAAQIDDDDDDNDSSSGGGGGQLAMGSAAGACVLMLAVAVSGFVRAVVICWARHNTRG